MEESIYSVQVVCNGAGLAVTTFLDKKNAELCFNDFCKKFPKREQNSSSSKVNIWLFIEYQKDLFGTVSGTVTKRALSVYSN